MSPSKGTSGRGRKRSGLNRFGRRSYWNADGSICMPKYIMLQFLKENSLFWRKPSQCQVHLVGFPPPVVPSSVASFLGRAGLKFITSAQRSMSIQTIDDSLHDFARRLRLRLHFGDSVHRHQTGLLRLRSTWDPLHCGFDNGKVEPFLSRLRLGLIEKLAARNFSNPNTSVADFAALRWLKRNPQVRAVDSDKNLGMVLACEKWLLAQARVHLEDSSTYLSVQFCVLATSLCHAFVELDDLVTSFSSNGIIDSKLAEFLVSKWDRRSLEDPLRFKPAVPLFRLNVKVHKDPVATRPITNYSRFFLAPAAAYLCQMLKPLTRFCRSVIESSAEIIPIIENFTTFPDMLLVEIDVKDMYPSLPTLPDGSGLSVFEEVVSAVRRSRLYSARTASFIASLLHMVLSHQCVTFNGEYFLMTKGLSMGIACAGQLANIFMNVLDERMSWTLLWRRYIDDALAFIHGQDLPRLQLELARFHHSISFKVLGKVDSANFLDLNIYCLDCKLAVRMFRKVDNAYLYLNPRSAHPRAMYQFVQAETLRILRNSTIKSDFLREVEFFRVKLLQRGYPVNFVRAQTSGISFFERQAVLGRLLARIASRKDGYAVSSKLPDCIPLVLKFMPEIDKQQIQHLLVHNAHLLPKQDLALRVVYKLGVNVFRLTYAWTWLQPWNT